LAEQAIGVGNDSMEEYDPEMDQIHVVLGPQDLKRRKVQRED